MQSSQHYIIKLHAYCKVCCETGTERKLEIYMAGTLIPGLLHVHAVESRYTCTSRNDIQFKIAKSK